MVSISLLYEPRRETICFPCLGISSLVFSFYSKRMRAKLLVFEPAPSLVFWNHICKVPGSLSLRKRGYGFELYLSFISEGNNIRLVNQSVGVCALHSIHPCCLV
uniref:Uncharacterized protein n=1 Tax=Utricularia reniformis TaxID=192314 RepID=A0A1Y0B1G7_9LAMI|nr:hypothetical protein AEK19_MT1015 [Utricularia reniformis]ART31237.1 hypothetical protein AEK19_MT1015 [Utricularia reniformis]